MNRKPVTQDSGRSSDWGSHAQTDKPWKGHPRRSNALGMRSAQETRSALETRSRTWKSGMNRTRIDARR